MKVALVYDWINIFGGAERVLLTLHNLFPQAPLFASVYDKRRTPWANVFEIKTSFLQKIPSASYHHELFPYLTPIAFENMDFTGFDLVISVTSSDAKGIITKPGCLHICYLLTPTRYLWSHQDFYLSNPVLKFISSPIVSYLKRWDRVSKTRPDYLIAISKTVKERIRKYYQIQAEVIYPPVSLGKFFNRKTVLSSGNYFLVVSRLVPFKRVELVVNAFNKLRLPLVIVGTGRQEIFLKSIACSTITFVKNLTEDDLISYYQNCRALILPSEEDFGMVSVEAQAAGKPVIAFDQGGARETIKEGITGVFFKEQTTNSLIKTLSLFKNLEFSQDACRENSKRYSETIFKAKFTEIIRKYYKKYIKDLDLPNI